MNWRFGYAFEPFELPDHGYFYRPVLEWREIGVRTLSAGGIEFLAYMQDHGNSKSLGLRFGDIAYSTDVVQLDDTAFELLKDLRSLDVFAKYLIKNTRIWIGFLDGSSVLRREGL